MTWVEPANGAGVNTGLTDIMGREKCGLDDNPNVGPVHQAVPPASLALTLTPTFLNRTVFPQRP